MRPKVQLELLCSAFPFLIYPVKHRPKWRREKKTKQVEAERKIRENNERNDRVREDERREAEQSDLAEARGTGRELSDLDRLVVIGVVLVVRIDVVITIGARWRGRGEIK